MNVDKRRIDACLKACEGISTQNLEDNVPVLELARRYNVVLCERDELRAKIEAMERQKPVGEIVAFGESLHEVSWNRGKLPPLGAKIYALPGAKGEEK